ncbi:MAG: RNA polymerase sigma factor SigA [Patescibacteria group bacterium]|nr:MAG: RNA polymerase sigma factor SigA [Patescibacteria group bacterium]
MVKKIKEATDKKGKFGLTDAIVSRLVTKGKKQGFLTLDNILELFPQAEEELELLDSLYERLVDAGVDVFDVESEKEAEKISKLEDIDLSQIKLDKTVSSDPVRMYLREIGNYNLLTSAEEVDLAKKAEVLRYRRVLNELQKAGKKRPSPKEIAKEMGLREREVKEIIAFSKNVSERESMRAHEMLIKANTRLVVSIAKKHMGRGLQFLDLIQEGNMGLMKAVDKFDWRRGFKFSTYATWWIRQAITRAIADQAKTIRVPVHMVETIHKYKKIERELEQKYERAPTPEEVAKVMGIEAEKAHDIVKIAQDVTSLETPVGKEEDTRLKEFIEDETTLSPFEAASRELLKGHIDEVLQSLNPRERKVLELRFGLRDGRTRTLEEVGKEFGVTRERIRQIEAKALRKLRHPSRSKRLRDYL